MFSDNYEIFFDNLIPRIYKYNSDQSGRYHSGYVAQEVDDAIKVAGLSKEDFAAIRIENSGASNEKWGLIYHEFISLNTWQIQKLKQRVAELESLVTELMHKE
jgi:hypothetical protein